jgi:hypothetical protein
VAGTTEIDLRPLALLSPPKCVASFPFTSCVAVCFQPKGFCEGILPNVLRVAVLATSSVTVASPAALPATPSIPAAHLAKSSPMMPEGVCSQEQRTRWAIDGCTSVLVSTNSNLWLFSSGTHLSSGTETAAYEVHLGTRPHAGQVFGQWPAAATAGRKPSFSTQPAVR